MRGGVWDGAEVTDGRTDGRTDSIIFVTGTKHLSCYLLSHACYRLRLLLLYCVLLYYAAEVKGSLIVYCLVLYCFVYLFYQRNPTLTGMSAWLGSSCSSSSISSSSSSSSSSNSNLSFSSLKCTLYQKLIIDLFSLHQTLYYQPDGNLTSHPTLWPGKQEC